MLVGLPLDPRDWPFIGIIMADDRAARGFAVLVNPTTAITEVPVSGTSIRVCRNSHRLQLRSEEDGLCVWTIDPPANLTPDQRPPLVISRGTAECTLLQVDDSTYDNAGFVPGVVLSNGSVSYKTDSEAGVVSGFHYSEDRTAMGSPVITDLGIIGFAGTSGSNSSVTLADTPQALLLNLWETFVPRREMELPFSPGAKAILDEALLLHSWRTNPTPAPASLVLCAAVVEAARRDDATVLSTFVGRHGKAGELGLRLGLQIHERVPGAGYVEAAFPPPFIDLVTRAATLADDLGSEGIHARHVLAAAVIDDESLTGSLLTVLGSTAPELRRTLRDVVDTASPEDDSAVWDAFLTSTVAPLDLEGGTTADFVDPTHAFPLDRDTLGVATYVRMLADLIASRQTPQPLSVGLFGAWGSGKSFFMGMLRHEIARLSKESPARHCSEIAHVTFNAWHYSDTNLWASLGDEIFRQLLGPDSVGETDIEKLKKQRAQLAHDLETQREARVELLQAKNRAITETAQARTDLVAARKSSAKQKVHLLSVARQSPILHDELDKAFRSLGVKDLVSQADALADAVSDSVDDVKALAAMARNRRARWFLAAGLVVLAVTAVVSFFAPRMAATFGIAGTSTLLAAGILAANWARSGLQMLRKVADDLQTSDAKAREAATLPALDAYWRAKAREESVGARLTTVTRRAEQIEHDLNELRPDARLFKFLLERSESPEYQGRLGLISIVRRDLDRLAQLMSDWRKNPREGRTPIDRIVLYIDDLDRCEPEQVVEVLQAIHLLLALDLFTVVVGVDPRWIVRSLREKYPATLARGDYLTSEADGGVTPEDYLEKIFNIPFVLPRMDPDAFGRFVSAAVDLPRNKDNQHNELQADQQATVVHEAATGLQHHGGLNATNGTSTPGEDTQAVLAIDAASQSKLHPTPIEIQPQSPLAASSPSGITAVTEPLKLNDDEKALLKAVGGLLETPREGTRVLNLYRMLRATRDLSRSREFLGSDTRPGEFQAVIVLLAMLTAHPSLMGALLDHPPSRNQDDPRAPRGGILHWHPSSTWADIVRGIMVPPGATANRICEVEPAAVPYWNSLGAGLEPTLALVDLPDLRALQEWAPRVARFSFLLLPISGQHH